MSSNVGGRGEREIQKEFVCKENNQKRLETNWAQQQTSLGNFVNRSSAINLSYSDGSGPTGAIMSL